MDNEQRIRQELFGARVKASREHAGISQYALAARIGSTQAAITAYERGVRVPRWPDLRGLAAALDVDPSWLVAPLIDSFFEPPDAP